MNILILGSGGREHTICWKINQSKKVKAVYVAPGNAGTERIATNVPLQVTDFDAIATFALEENIGMIIVGPEVPLVDGIVDYFKQSHLQHIALIGPDKQGALLEGSKAFAKKFMDKYGIPTAKYGEFTKDTMAEGFDFIENQQAPIVLKCDGLAAGKGVLILDSKDAAKAALQSIFEGKFGTAGNTVVIEDFLDGVEFSVFALTDGSHYKLLPIAKDYKRIGEADTGLNTGGMGAVSPPPFVDEALFQKVVDRIIEPTIKGIGAEGMDYKGFVFFGLINVKGEPYVIEYNCRLGDPETEVILPRLQTDLLELLQATTSGNLDSCSVQFNEHAAATVMLVSGGYPEAYEKGKLMSGLATKQEQQYLFHAGTKLEDGQVYTNGGRVLAITSLSEDFKDAVAKSMQVAENIHFEGKYFRTDIGFDL